MSDTDENILPEIKLIEILKGVLSKELGENISNKKLGGLLLTSNRFNRTIRENSKFRSISIDKIEENIKLLVKNRANLNIALNGLKSYRITQGYINIEDAEALPEFILIKRLQTIFHEAEKELLPLSNLGKLFGSKNLFIEVITSNSQFRNITINRIEQKLQYLLDEPFLSEALEVLYDYRIIKGHLATNTLQNQDEIELIKTLQDLYSKELDYLISNNELSKKFGSRLLLNEALRKGTNFVKLTLERMQNSVEKDLSKENQLAAFKAIETYKMLKKLTICDNSINQPEIDLIKDLRDIFSPQGSSLISVNELTNILYPLNRNLLHFALKNNTVFMNFTIDEMIKNVKLNLTDKNLELAIQALTHYKTLKRFEKKIEYFNAESRLNEEITRSIFQELFQPLQFPTVSIYIFPWLIGPKGGPMHIDGYNRNLNLGFEYNGIQHYEVDTLYNKSKKDLLYMQQKDSHKSKLLNKNGIRIITIPYTVKVKDRINFIVEECRKLNIRVSEGVINISIKDIEKRVREKIKNRAKEKRNKTHENSRNKPENNIQNMRTPYPYNRPRKKNLNEEDFSDPYFWFSPQVREAIQSKADSLIDQVHADINIPENFSDRWEEVSNYDVSDLESITTEVPIDNPNTDIIPDQDIEPNPEVPKIQEHGEADDIDIITPDEEIEDSLPEQQDLIEDQINDLENISEPEIREEDLRPDDFDPVNEPPYDPISQPVTDLIPPPEPSSIPDKEITPPQKSDSEPQYIPQNQHEQEDNSQVPEKSQDEVGTEQSIEEISNDSKPQDIEPIINEHIEPIHIPELNEIGNENPSDKTDVDPDNPENPNQDDSKDIPDLDEKEEETDKDKEEKKEIGGEEEDDKDEKKEEDDKDEIDGGVDEEKDDENEEKSKEDEDDPKEDEGESDKEPQEDPYDDMDDFEEEPEHGFTPEDMYDIMREFIERMYPQIYSFQSSNLGSIPINEIDFTDKFGEKDNLPGINDCIDDFGQYRNENIPIDSFDELSEKFDEEDKFDNLM